MTSRLAEFQIDGLFDLYSYHIPLKIDERITIIIGPNGRGKTVCLKFVEALFRKDFAYFTEIPFKTANFIFTDGVIIEIVAVDKVEGEGAESSHKRSVNLMLVVPGQEPVELAPTKIDVALRREISRFVPSNWQLINHNLWIDRNDNEECTLSEIVRRHHIPKNILNRIQKGLPEPFNALIEKIDCHLIETQRLLVLRENIEDEE